MNYKKFQKYRSRNIWPRLKLHQKDKSQDLKKSIREYQKVWLPDLKTNPEASKRMEQFWDSFPIPPCPTDETDETWTDRWWWLIGPTILLIIIVLICLIHPSDLHF